MGEIVFLCFIIINYFALHVYFYQREKHADEIQRGIALSILKEYDEDFADIEYEEQLARENIEEEFKEEIPVHKHFPHTLLVGQGGLGKTTLAHIIKNELEKLYCHPIRFHGLTPSQLSSPSDLDKLMTEIQAYDIVFIDEIHGLKKNIAESLYQAIEKGYYHVTKDKKTELGNGIYVGQTEQTFQTRELPPFTCIGGTTEGGDLPKPLIMRFHRINLNNYQEKDLEKIVENYLKKDSPKNLADYIGQETAKKEIIMEFNALQQGKYVPETSSEKEAGFPITDEAKRNIASRSFGTPRIAIKYAKKCRSYAMSEELDRIDKDIVEGYMRMINVDVNGLTTLHRIALKILLEYYPKEASTNTLVEKMNVSRGEVENIYFPDLTFKNYAKRSSRSWRMATEKAVKDYNYLLC